ncbi:MAG TPA: isoleucine--tRNA ligase [Actinomycetota bacterium]
MTSFRPVPAQPDHIGIEHAVLDRWAAGKTFETLRDANRGGPKWSFLDGPITANNPMGVHHAWGRTLKDVFQRYHAMLGHDLRYQNGFDCQGLWVEVEVEKALGLNSKPEIEAYGLDRFARACRDRVAKYAGVQTEQSRRLGQWMDWDASYFTMTDANISAIWGFLAECHRRGWLYVGHRSMPWCPRCGTSLSQHELIDSYSEITHPSVFARFPLKGREHEYLAVWTTTPWTLPANVAAAVLPGADYARVETLAGVAIVAADRVEHLPIQGKVLGTVKGSELVGLTYEGPFDELPAQAGVEHRVVAWDEVSLEEGTGIVHIAPGCGAEDFELGKREGLAVLVPIDESGAFYESYGWLHGNHTGDVAREIIGDLGERGRLIDAGELTHRYPTCWRCHTELVYRVVDEWFISCDEVRGPMLDAVREVTWTPPQYGKRMEDWLNNMGDWCISRKRYWGLPLPFWFCADGHMTIVGSKAELREKALSGIEGLEELHRPWIDAVTVPCEECGKEATRTTDVGDCWLDAGIVPFSTLGWRNDMLVSAGYAEGAGEGLTVADLPDHAYWEQWFPVDWVSESREQIRLWFYSMLFMSVVLDGRAPYADVLVYERVTDETGRPMHKSWGNAIWFDDAVESMGADAMRWVYAGQVPSQNLGFGYGPANAAKRTFLTLWNVYKFFVEYAIIDGYAPRSEVLRDGPDLAGGRSLDRWMVSRTNELVARCRAAMDAFDSPRVTRAIERYWDDLSNWYLRLSRARFWKTGDTDREAADKRAAYDTLWYSLCTVLRVMAPVTPFVTDEMWANLTGPCEDAPPSVHLAGYPGAAPADGELLAAMRDVRTVVELGRSARQAANVKIRQGLRAVVVATEDAQARARLVAHEDLIRGELNVKEVRLASSAEDFAQVEVVPNFKVLGPRLGKDVGRVQQLLRDGGFTRDGSTVRAGEWTLQEGEFEVRTRAREGFAVVDGGGFAVALDTEITPELALEAAARDRIRTINDLRKAHDLALTDRIRVSYPAADAEVFAAHGSWIAAETLAVAAEQGDALAIERA